MFANIISDLKWPLLLAVFSLLNVADDSEMVYFQESSPLGDYSVSTHCIFCHSDVQYAFKGQKNPLGLRTESKNTWIYNTKCTYITNQVW